MNDISDQLSDIGKRRGIVYPSFEIYGGLSGFIDYGPLGKRIKQNIEDALRRDYVISQSCMEVECPTVSPEEVWNASGHVESFADLLVACPKCKESYRADKLLEDKGVHAEGKPADEVAELLTEHKISCLKCQGELSKPYSYNLMFKTSVGTKDGGKTSYLRPETAQTTYLAFRRLWEYARRKLPFGVLQMGHSFRNEISPRQGMLRLREFNQAEIQFFTDPENQTFEDFERFSNISVKITDKNDKQLEMTIGEAHDQGVIKNQFLAAQLGAAMQFLTCIGIEEIRLGLRQHRDDELAFYSSDTWDVEFQSSVYGKIEIVGIADRSDYDLKQHMGASLQDMSVSFDGRKFVPYVVEVAYGIDRPLYCVLESCMVQEEDRTLFKFPRDIAPYRVGVFSLVKKDGVKEKTDEIHKSLCDKGIYSFLDHGGSIGKRYARSDEVGIPYCITVDYDTMRDGTVTIRDRDSKEQKRIKIEDITREITG